MPGVRGTLGTWIEWEVGQGMDLGTGWGLGWAWGAKVPWGMKLGIRAGKVPQGGSQCKVAEAGQRECLDCPECPGYPT